MRYLKDRIPRQWRLQLQLARRQLHDYRRGVYGLFALPADNLVPLPFAVAICQPIRRSAYYENKLHNLQLGAERINRYLMLPGQYFSFWKAVGAPSAQNGFREGRNLINGRLVPDYGGGLCQLSGMLYLLALKTGLQVTERHHHSVDIYREEERFCPLGADATVVYGYKDLRLRNNYSFPIAFQLTIAPEQVNAKITGAQALPDLPLAFNRYPYAEGVLVRTLRSENGVQKELTISTYRSVAK